MLPKAHLTSQGHALSLLHVAGGHAWHLVYPTAALYVLPGVLLKFFFATNASLVAQSVKNPPAMQETQI